MSARSIRGAIRNAALCLAAAAMFVCAPVVLAETEHHSGPIPFARIGADFAGDALADAAFHSPVPILIVAGATYKVADLAHDLGDAAVDREDRWLGAEMILADDDAKRLKAIGAAGGDLNGDDANAIKARLRDRAFEMTIAQQSPGGYTLRVVIKNLPYAVKKVAVDKLIEQAIGLALKKLHVDKLIEPNLPTPKKINFALNYGGPLERFEKGLGWGKLGTRARVAAKAADECMRDVAKAAAENMPDAAKAAEESIRDQDAKMIADYLSSDRRESLERSAEDALGSIYHGILARNPSQPRVVVVEMYRLEAAREAVMLPAPEPALVAADPVTEEPDPVVRTIQSDDASVERYSNTAPSERRTFSSASAPQTAPPAESAPRVEQEDPQAAARRIALHQELMQVGDGKTFQVCSNGCPSSSDASWDGRKGQSLYGR